MSKEHPGEEPLTPEEREAEQRIIHAITRAIGLVVHRSGAPPHARASIALSLLIEPIIATARTSVPRAQLLALRVAKLLTEIAEADSAEKMAATAQLYGDDLKKHS